MHGALSGASEGEMALYYHQSGVMATVLGSRQNTGADAPTSPLSRTAT